MDLRKTCVLKITTATILTPFRLRSGLWENYSDVCCIPPPSIKILTLRTRSEIVREIERMRKVGLALMAYFFFDFRDTQKQHQRGLISSLLFQLIARSDTCAMISSLASIWTKTKGGTRRSKVLPT